MARPLRIEFPGALYHVISRGNEQQPIVRDDIDCQRRLHWLQRAVETYGWRLHGFVVMPNHEHLFVETPAARLSDGMQFLNGSYTSYFNRRHDRVGHLFQGRFKGHLIEQDGYFMAVSRYIHLNPVRAKLAVRPEDYPWSSYPGYVRSARALEWVTYRRVLGEFGSEPAQARRAYARFVHAGMDDPPTSPWAGAAGGLLLGSPRFVDRIRQMLSGRSPEKALPELKQLRPCPSLEHILGAVARYFRCRVADWKSGSRTDDASRAMAAYLARVCFGYSATSIAAALGYNGPSSVSHAVRRIQNGPKTLLQTAAELEKQIG